MYWCWLVSLIAIAAFIFSCLLNDILQCRLTLPLNNTLVLFYLVSRNINFWIQFVNSKEFCENLWIFLFSNSVSHSYISQKMSAKKWSNVLWTREEEFHNNSTCILPSLSFLNNFLESQEAPFDWTLWSVCTK